MLARVTTFALEGLEARRVWVEVDIRPGLPAFGIVGLGDKAVREARERVRAAILNSGFEFPMRRITANLAPAYLRKVGPSFDLPLALGVLAATGQVPREPLARLAVFGELSLGGELRSAHGTLAVAEGARRARLRGVLLAREHGAEAALVDDVEVIAVETLRAAADVLAGAAPPPVPERPGPEPQSGARELDLAEVEGQPLAVHALVVAAAGGHNLLLIGPPGTGKTMLARRLPTILPPLTRAEAIEVTRIHSLAGLRRGAALITERPFRAPHHVTSASGLVGGGSNPAPGEASLAHHGVLFLDELAEFPRTSLEALRQPLEDGHVTVVRGQRALRFPSRFMLVAATNPCPCGMAGGADACRCTEADHARYRRRLSEPLIDRIDLVVAMERPEGEVSGTEAAPSSAALRADVLAARERQRTRLAAAGVDANARLSAAALRRDGDVSEAAEDRLADAYRRGYLSARGRMRVLRVARTLADLAGRRAVEATEVDQALALRDWAPAGAMAA